ncbi:MAG: Uma2 family endonuclease [Acidimicrobiia bacterium]|nr:Uma2 family endonuclease [Acidimicrobiia bacterium]
MGAATQISVEEYLRSAYDPDCDYVDGSVEERNVGERDHSRIQISIGSYFFVREKQWGIRGYTEQRLRVSARRFRIPDVCIVAGPKPTEKVFTKPPLICIEILSEEDRLARMQQRIDDYLAMGVANIWLIDPESRRAWICTAAGNLEAKEGFLRVPDTPIEVPLAEIFSVLD